MALMVLRSPGMALVGGIPLVPGAIPAATALYAILSHRRRPTSAFASDDLTSVVGVSSPHRVVDPRGGDLAAGDVDPRGDASAAVRTAVPLPVVRPWSAWTECHDTGDHLGTPVEI